MAYERQNWVNYPDENATILDAEKMEHIEDGIIANEEAIEGKADASEVTEIKADLTELNDELVNELGRHESSSGAIELYDVSQVQTGYPYGNIGEVVKHAAKNSYQVIDVNDGDVFDLTSWIYTDGYHFLAIWTDENNVILEKFNPTVPSARVVNNVRVIAPTNAKKLYVTLSTSYTVSILKYMTKTYSYSIPSRSIDLDSLSDALSSDFVQKYPYSWYNIGDSWSQTYNPSTGAGGTAHHKWCEYVAKDLGLTLTNKAVAGTGYKAGSPNFGRQVTSYIPSNYDGLVTIFGSGNDCTGNYDLGTSDDVYVDGGDNTVGACINLCFDNIGVRCPLAKVIIFSPCAWGIYPPTNADNRMINYCNLLKECAEKHGFRYVDMYRNSDLRPWDDRQASLWYETSGSRVHPNDKGHYFLYPFMRDEIRRSVPTIPMITD